MDILKFLGFIWSLPTTLVMMFYFMPLWIFGYIQYWGKDDTFILVFVLTDKPSWYRARWEQWEGFSSPAIILLKQKPETDAVKTIEKHEHRHCYQHYVFGIFTYPTYIAISLFIYFFLKNLQPYLDNPFEIDARRYGGQLVYIPRIMWPESRWPW
jgi:hypothetical protein